MDTSLTSLKLEGADAGTGTQGEGRDGRRDGREDSLFGDRIVFLLRESVVTLASRGANLTCRPSICSHQLDPRGTDRQGRRREGSGSGDEEGVQLRGRVLIIEVFRRSSIHTNNQVGRRADPAVTLDKKKKTLCHRWADGSNLGLGRCALPYTRRPVLTPRGRKTPDALCSVIWRRGRGGWKSSPAPKRLR